MSIPTIKPTGFVLNFFLFFNLSKIFVILIIFPVDLSITTKKPSIVIVKIKLSITECLTFELILFCQLMLPVSADAVPPVVGRLRFPRARLLCSCALSFRGIFCFYLLAFCILLPPPKPPITLPLLDRYISVFCNTADFDKEAVGNPSLLRGSYESHAL